MELIDDPGHHALRLARLLGFTQETRRLGCTVVATEHLLMATLSDPIIRWKAKDVGVDLQDVQTRVRRETAARPAREGEDLAMTREAADLLVEAEGRVGGLDVDHRPDPDMVSTVMSSLIGTLLGDDRDTAARRILVELDLVQHASRLVGESA